MRALLNLARARSSSGGSGDNVVTGQVTVLKGTMQLSKTGGATPFSGDLVIGDNQSNVMLPQATVQLSSGNQIPEVNFYKTGLNSVTVNSNGKLDLGTNSDTIGQLNMVTGRSTSALVTSTGAGTLT